MNVSDRIDYDEVADTLEALLGSSHELEASLRNALALLNLYDEKAIGKDLSGFYSRAGKLADALDEVHMEVRRYTDRKVQEHAVATGQL